VKLNKNFSNYLDFFKKNLKSEADNNLDKGGFRGKNKGLGDVDVH
jgi:hypothetical protein